MSAKKRKQNYSTDDLYSAIAAVHGGMSKRKASQQWNLNVGVVGWVKTRKLSQNSEINFSGSIF